MIYFWKLASDILFRCKRNYAAYVKIIMSFSSGEKKMHGL